MDRQQRETATAPPNRTLCLLTLIAAFAYTVLLGWTRNPLGRSSTLSWIGYDYPTAFVIWGILTASAFFINLLALYRRSGCRGRVGMACLHAAPFAAFPVVLINDWGWEQYVHLMATVLFVLLNGGALILFFVYHARRGRRYGCTAFAAAAVLIASVTAHAAVRQNGLTELVPICSGLILLFLANFTGIYPAAEPPAPPRWRRNVKYKTAATLAFALGMLGADDFYLGRPTRACGHLMTTYAGVWLFICRYTGIGHLNDLQGETAWLLLAAGLSALAGSLAWAIADGIRLRSRHAACLSPKAP